MNKKLLTRLVCALLSVLMLVCMIPAITVSAATPAAATMTDDELKAYVSTAYPDAEARLAAMTPIYNNGTYTLYCDNVLGDVAYRNNKTGEIMFSNPWEAGQLDAGDEVYNTMMSQIVLKYVDSTGSDPITYYSYMHAAMRRQLTVKPIKNGVRVEYAIGDRSARTLIPQMIEREAFETKILAPLAEHTGGKGSTEYQRLAAYYTPIYYATYMNQGKTQMAEDMATIYPVVKEKGIDMYVLSSNIGTRMLDKIESWITKYCPEYTFEEMDNDHEYVRYEEQAISPPVFDVALEYTLDEHGLVVTLPAKGLRYDETAYRITDFVVLPYMGASVATNEGYTFLPDGSGALFALDENKISGYDQRVYGEDFSLTKNVSEAHNSIVRMPIYGQVETMIETDAETGATVEVKRGFLAIIEEGESLAKLRVSHKTSSSKQVGDEYVSRPYSTVYPAFFTRQNDTSVSGSKSWAIYANRRYTDDYQIRYVMLTDDKKAETAALTSYYECSWMGMACAYRDYLDRTADGFDRLTGETAKESIPLYIETFGCVDSIEKVLSMPVTVSVPLTSFENVATMYDYLAGKGVSNVNFKLTGYANGGMYAEVPYKLKWDKAVGGKSGFEDLTAYAAEKGFALYPDFDFVYTSQADGGSKVNMKKNAARTIENRYTSRRLYSATQQTLVSYYQMVLSPATYSKFYEKLGKRYEKFENATGISLETFGNSLNSDYDEDKTTLREEAKTYVMEALAYFGDKYDVMLDEANAYTWRYSDHLLNMPLDSSRYEYELNTIPFVGVVLHGYVQFAGKPLNMEGDLKYAMLKAMENGASVYFVLSYANTELLKEDVLLSQNYSVRYDIWQSRLVDIYNELNSVLFDVQTKLIVGHKFLEGVRIPDEDELLEDIAKEAEDLAEQIKNQLDAEHLLAVSRRQEARKAAVNAAGNINLLVNDINYGYLDLMDYERAAAKRYKKDENGETVYEKDVNGDYKLDKDGNKIPVLDGAYTVISKSLIRNWSSLIREIADAEKYEYELDADTISSFYNAFQRSIVARMVNMNKNKTQAAQYLVDAMKAEIYLIEDEANEALLEMAAEGVAAAKVAFEDFMELYYGCDVTVSIPDDLLEAEDPTAALLACVVVDEAAQDWIVKYDSETHEIVYNVAKYGDEEAAKAALYSYIFTANDENVELGFGLKAVYDAFVVQLINDGLYDPAYDAETAETPKAVQIDVAAMVADLTKPVVEEDNTTEEDAAEEKTEVSNKYLPDGDIVLVTYGEPGQKFGDAGTKSLILNFNDYAIRTTLENGMTYTIEAYGYVVIYS